MKLSKICKYLDDIEIEYNYRVLDGLTWITINDKLNNFVRIDEKTKNTIRLTFQNISQNIILTNVFKNQKEVLEVLKIKDRIVVVDKNFMKKIK